MLGDIAFTIDARPLDFHDTVTYLGAMFTGIPNMVWVFGYFRAAWTLRADMIAEFVCRLLAHMEDKGAEVVVPQLRPGEEDMPLHPWIDPENFNPGYMRRGVHLLPQQGDRAPWVHTQDYWREKELDPERRPRRRRARVRVSGWNGQAASPPASLRSFLRSTACHSGTNIAHEETTHVKRTIIKAGVALSLVLAISVGDATRTTQTNRSTPRRCGRQ